MEENGLRAELTALTGQLMRYADAYYGGDAPLISDMEYDTLYDRLLVLEQTLGVSLPGSPTHRVGGEAGGSTAGSKAADAGNVSDGGFAPHTHLARLWSLDKVRTPEALTAFVERINRAAGGSTQFALEYKFDGLTVNLTYAGGRLVDGATRGNGVTGESILPQLATVRTLPRSIPFTGRMEVQGECIMRLSVLETFNKTADEPLKNARNAAAGALRNLDPAVTAARKLDVYCYNVGYIEGKTLHNQKETLAFLAENGFPVSPYIRWCENAAELLHEINKAEQARGTLDFLIDGMVIKASDFALREALGHTDKFPRWAMAYKFAAEETTSVVEDVTWELGRTGKLTPLAHLAPVELAGATIRRATLNNYDDILRKRVGIGSRVFLRRSNDVIPEILGAVPDDTPLAPVEKPACCPSCGAHVEQRGAHLFCTNSLSCRPQIVGRMAHYASRDAMDIDSLSDKTIAQLADSLGVSSIPALYTLTLEQLVPLERFAEKKAQNLLDALEKSKKRPLAAFLFALGIPNVGVKTARDLAGHFGTLSAVRSASAEALLAIPDVGETVSESIVSFFADPSIAAQVDALLAAGVSPEEADKTASGGALSGKSVVVTGTLATMDRRAAENRIAAAGGKASGSVSKNTSFVLSGENAGSKLDKAIALGIPVLDEAAFLALIGEKA